MNVTAERIRLLNASDDKKGLPNLSAGFAYLRTHEIAFEDLDYDLQPADAWAALEAMHDLPLTLYDGSKPRGTCTKARPQRWCWWTVSTPACCNGCKAATGRTCLSMRGHRARSRNISTAPMWTFAPSATRW